MVQKSCLCCNYPRREKQKPAFLKSSAYSKVIKMVTSEHREKEFLIVWRGQFLHFAGRKQCVLAGGLIKNVNRSYQLALVPEMLISLYNILLSNNQYSLITHQIYTPIWHGGIHIWKQTSEHAGNGEHSLSSLEGGDMCT